MTSNSFQLVMRTCLHIHQKDRQSRRKDTGRGRREEKKVRKMGLAYVPKTGRRGGRPRARYTDFTSVDSNRPVHGGEDTKTPVLF